MRAAQVEIVGTGSRLATVTVYGSDEGTIEMRGVAVTGPAIGVLIVQDSGGNVCGCEAPSEDGCAVETFDIEPPPDPTAER